MPKNILASNQDRFKNLHKKYKNCKRCGLCKVRTNVVVGYGDMESRFVIIGQNPGASEDVGGKPFVGQAGQELNKVLRKWELDRDEFYITNAISCLTPSNRKPTEDEVKACSGRLKTIIDILDPIVIVCLGGTAIESMFPVKKTRHLGVFASRGIYRRDIIPYRRHLGKVNSYKDRRRYICITLHPAALLYDHSGQSKKTFYKDWKRFAELIYKVKEGL